MNASFSELINLYKSTFISADDMSFANDTIHLATCQTNRWSCIISLIQVRTEGKHLYFLQTKRSQSKKL